MHETSDQRGSRLGPDNEVLSLRRLIGMPFWQNPVKLWLILVSITDDEPIVINVSLFLEICCFSVQRAIIANLDNPLSVLFDQH